MIAVVNADFALWLLRFEYNTHTTQEEARDYFTRLTGLYKNLNYATTGTAEYAGILAKINQLYDSCCKR